MHDGHQGSDAVGELEADAQVEEHRQEAHEDRQHGGALEIGGHRAVDETHARDGLRHEELVVGLVGGKHHLEPVEIAAEEGAEDRQHLLAAGGRAGFAVLDRRGHDLVSPEGGGDRVFQKGDIGDFELAYRCPAGPGARGLALGGQVLVEEALELLGEAELERGGRRGHLRPFRLSALADLGVARVHVDPQDEHLQIRVQRVRPLLSEGEGRRRQLARKHPLEGAAVTLLGLLRRRDGRRRHVLLARRRRGA